MSSRAIAEQLLPNGALPVFPENIPTGHSSRGNLFPHIPLYECVHLDGAERVTIPIGLELLPTEAQLAELHIYQSQTKPEMHALTIETRGKIDPPISIGEAWHKPRPIAAFLLNTQSNVPLSDGLRAFSYIDGEEVVEVPLNHNDISNLYPLLKKQVSKAHSRLERYQQMTTLHGLLSNMVNKER